MNARGAGISIGRGTVIRASDVGNGAHGGADGVAASGTFGWLEMTETRHGRMLANPRDVWVGRSLLLYGEYSEAEVELFKRIVQPGDVVVEVGANIGAHTIPLSRMAGEKGFVWAYEPQRLAFQNLCANVALNGLTNVIGFPLALGARPGGVQVPVMDPWVEQNFGGLELEGQDQGERVALGTLDGFGLARLDFLKVDVEGMEIEVLYGAKGTIDKHRPVIYVEADREQKSLALLHHVFDAGYRAWWHFPPLFNPKNHAGNSDAGPFNGIVSINLLCLPDGMTPADDLINPVAEVKDAAETWRMGLKRLNAATS